jgi:hypothetical protein
MTGRKHRGTNLKKLVDGSHGSRIRYAVRQAGSPESLASVTRALNRLAFSIRKSAPGRIKHDLVRAFGCFKPALVGRPSPSAARRIKKRGGARQRAQRKFSAVPPPPSLAVKPQSYVGSLPPQKGVVRRLPPRLQKRAIRFVASSAPYPLEANFQFHEPPPERLTGGVLRARQIEWLGFDLRVHGTFLEHSLCRSYRRAQWDVASRTRSPRWTPDDWFLYSRDNGFPPSVPVGEFLPLDSPVPWPRARIGVYELHQVLVEFNRVVAECSDVPPSSVAAVLTDAWSELEARLANLKVYKPVKKLSALEEAGWYGADSFM